MGDYGFRSEVEPRISKSESFLLREVIAKSENNLEEAIVYLEEKIENDSSAALDFAWHHVLSVKPNVPLSTGLRSSN